MTSRWRLALLLPALCAYALVFSEFFLRLMKPTPLLPRYVTAAPYGVRTNVAGARYWQTTEEVRVQVRINPQGIRSDREIPVAKADGDCRIVLYGDSFFMGYEVDLDDSFAVRLEHALRSAGAPCEVVNLSVSGFGTAEMLVALRADGLRYEPDLVIFQWHNTDPADNLRSGLFEMRGGKLERAAPTYLPAVEIRDRLSRYWIYRWAIENSHLYASAREAAAARIKSMMVSAKKSVGPSDSSSDEGSRGGGAKPDGRLDALLLRTAQAEVQARDAAFLVVEIPTRVARTDFKPAPAAMSEKSRDGIAWVSPLRAFLDAADTDHLLYREKGHGHLTELGNQILTDVVVGYIQRERLLTAD